MEDIKGFYFNFKEFTFELKRKVLHIRSELELEPHSIDLLINSVRPWSK